MRIWFNFFQLLTFLHQDSLSNETQQNNNKDFFPPTSRMRFTKLFLLDFDLFIAEGHDEISQKRL